MKSCCCWVCGNKYDQNVGMFHITVLMYAIYAEFLFLFDIGVYGT